MEENKIEKIILETCIKIAKRKEGAIIILGDCKYKPLVNQDVSSFEIIKNQKLFESLALMDGAVIISNNGFLKAYGAMLEVKKFIIFKNKGTRHNSAISASTNKGTTAYVVSEEDTKIRIFKNGKLILEIDPQEKNIIEKIPEINKIVESVGFGTLGAMGAGALAPVIGIVAIPGVTIFVVTTGVSYFLKKCKDWGWTI
jgi:DNA integrity scanning protein DisA with diadenylate cyclase activity